MVQLGPDPFFFSKHLINGLNLCGLAWPSTSRQGRKKKTPEQYQYRYQVGTGRNNLVVIALFLLYRKWELMPLIYLKHVNSLTKPVLASRQIKLLWFINRSIHLNVSSVVLHWQTSLWLVTVLILVAIKHVGLEGKKLFLAGEGQM